MLTIATDAASKLKGWVARTFALIEGFQLVRPCWLKLLRLLVTNVEKERTVLVVNRLQDVKVQALEVWKACAARRVLMPVQVSSCPRTVTVGRQQVVGTREAWDRRAEMLAQDVGEDSWLEWHIQSVELLASISENRNPAAQIYASSQLTCRMAMDAAASADVKISGERIKVELPVQCVSFSLASRAMRASKGMSSMVAH